MVSTLLDTSALISSRDGIVGHWRAPDVTPIHMRPEFPDHLEFWDPELRAYIFAVEVLSKIGFSSENGTVSLWHLDGSPADGAHARFQLLVRMSRPSEGIFKRQLEFLEGYAALRPDRASEIHAQLDGPDAFFGSVAYLHHERTKWTVELLGLVRRMAVVVAQRIKYGLACRRPIEYSPQVQPIIPTPRHGAFPSGHAAEAFVVAYVLGTLVRSVGSEQHVSAPASTESAASRQQVEKSDQQSSLYLDPLWGEQLMRQAARIAINRQVAGVHFPVDSVAGTILGLVLGSYLVGRCQGASPMQAFEFVGTRYPCELDYFWRALFDTKKFVQIEAPPYSQVVPGQIEVQNSAILNWLWEKAKAEWI